MKSFCFSHIEDALHINFANSRSDGVYVEDASNVPLHLNAYCDSTTKETFTLPLVVSGADGVGKSAALANWSRQRKAKILPPRGLGYSDFIFTHSIGCSRLSTTILHLLRRLISSLINHFELKETFDLADEKLPWVLPRLLERASKKGKVIIVIDGLHHICSKDESYSLKWIPLRLPPNSRMILAVTKPCEVPPNISDYAIKRHNKIHHVYKEIQLRGLPMVNMKEFDEDLVASIVEKHLPPTSSRGQIPREVVMNQILSHELSKNALFLTTLLKGLQHVQSLGFKASEVAQCLSSWTSSDIKTTHDLIDAMLTVFESGLSNIAEASPPRHTLDTSEATKLGTLLHHSLSLLFVSRHGLREDELLELVARVRENVRWKNETKDTVIPIKIKILHAIAKKKNRLLELFRSFDTDGNGTIDREEFYNGMSRLNLGLTDAEVTRLLQEVDSNGDGEIDYMEMLSHFEDISRKYMHGGRRRSVFCDQGTAAVIAKDKESFTDDYKRSLIATLQCVGVVEVHNDFIAIPPENAALRDVVWKRYLRSIEGEAKSRAFLTEFFSKKEPCLRLSEELPWHLSKSNELAALKKLVTDLRVVDQMQVMYNAEELRPELLTYLSRLSRSNKFDIVAEYNRAMEKWQQSSSPSAGEIHQMVSFLGEVMLWYNKNASSSQMKIPAFMRVKLTLSQLEKLGLGEMHSQARKVNERNKDVTAEYYHLRWIWTNCPWLALKKTSQAMRNQSRGLTTAIPKQITSNEIPLNNITDSSRSRAMTSQSASKILSRIDQMIINTEHKDDLEGAFSRLNELKEVFDSVLLEASARSRLLEKLLSSRNLRARGDEKQYRQLAAGEVVLQQLQIRLDRLKEMTDAAHRIESCHEEILVVLQSCRPAFQTEHLELEQQLALAKQQMSDLRRQQDSVDTDINKAREATKQLESDTRMILEENRALRPQLDALRQRKIQEDYSLQEQAKRNNASFDPQRFNRRMKMEGIIAKRRQMKMSAQNEAKFAADAESMSALHPMHIIAGASGSFEPSQIAEKLKSSETLCRELSIKQEKIELQVKKKRGLLDCLLKRIHEYHLSFGDAQNATTVTESTYDTCDTSAALNSRKTALQQLNHLVNNIAVAIGHLGEKAMIIEQQDKEASLLPSFLFSSDDVKSSSGGIAKQIVKNIHMMQNALGDKTLPCDLILPIKQNTRVLSRPEWESKYDELTKKHQDDRKHRQDFSKDRDTAGDLEQLKQYLKQSRTNASEVEQRRANTLCRTSQAHKGLILESILQLKCKSP